MNLLHITPRYNITTFDDLESEMRNMNWHFEMIDDYSRYDDYYQMYQAIVQASMNQAKDNPEGVLDLWHAYAIPNGRSIPHDLSELID
tara:strand:+ start:669 stop:932 length:264 start_codon:yes stop_codon:yes gene_type:complete